MSGLLTIHFTGTLYFFMEIFKCMYGRGKEESNRKKMWAEWMLEVTVHRKSMPKKRTEMKEMQRKRMKLERKNGPPNNV